jgi:hypothetical protein
VTRIATRLPDVLTLRLRSETHMIGVRDGVTFMCGAKAPHLAPACGVGSSNGSHSVTDAVSRRVSGDEGDDGTE